jgi:very-short-patch-repair endonuclease
MKKYPAPGAHTRARNLRRNMTDAERRVWRILRLRQMDDHKFRRQVPLGRYIADFVCHDARLIVEIDGGQHDPSSLGEIERTRFLESEGYRILRFWNNEVLTNLDGVYSTIAAELDRILKPSPAMEEGWEGVSSLTESDRITPTPALPHDGGGSVR